MNERCRLICYIIMIQGATAPTNSDQICSPEDMECHNYNDHLGLEAIRSLHEQLDDDDNGDIDLSESDDVCRSL